jgi:hypothetical protein
MISSAPRLKVLVELVTNASITHSSTPESASLITSATGAVGLTLGGSGFEVDIGLAGASTTSFSAVGAAKAGLGAAGAGAAAFVVASGLTAGAALVG